MQSKLLKTIFLAGGLFMAVAAPAAAEDIKKGEAVFRQCAACHSLKAGENKIGPSLHGIFGRKAGAIDGFSYSSAMKGIGIIWDADKLNAYLAAPKVFVPENRMAFVGVKDPAKRADLIFYLRQASQ